jgi:hypothetical protein
MRRALFSLVVGLSCARSTEPTAEAPLPVVACDSSRMAGDWQEVDPAAIAVDLELDDPILAADLEVQLRALWGVARVSRGPTTAEWRIVLSTSESARAETGAGALDRGYAIRRSGKTIVVFGPTAADLAHGAYALLETFGLRFFHPKQTFVPKLATARWPRAIDVVRRPAFATRGLHVHTLHPVEWLPALVEPGEANLADAKLLIDWLVRTGQNHLQWFFLDSIPPSQWQPRLAEIVDYAHRRGVTVGAAAHLWGGASLQNALHMVDSKGNWQEQLEGNLEKLVAAPIDYVELWQGEFLATDPEQVVTWLDHATAYLAAKHPKVRIASEIHVGNFPKMWIDFRGEKDVFFYHLPKYADPALAVGVHTVHWFDLYRDWGAYEHPNFSLQREFLFDQITKRKVRYIPESAYWASADIDVPLFLPEYVESRWIDIHRLTGDLKERGLPELDGHVSYSSGHEWGYWLTDYLSAKIAWEPEKPLAHFLSIYSSAFGDCANDVDRALTKTVDLQREFLFDRRLLPYLAGEDAHDDFGVLGGIVTIPKRVPFEEVARMDPSKRATFETEVVGSLARYAAESEPPLEAVRARCRGADPALASWCDELADGIEIGRVRALHAEQTYRAVLAFASGDVERAREHLANARAITTQRARALVEARARGYRFPLEDLVGRGKNPTSYRFRLLAQAHSLCFWSRREEQVAWLLEHDEPAPFSQISSCQD